MSCETDDARKARYEREKAAKAAGAGSLTTADPAPPDPAPTKDEIAADVPSGAPSDTSILDWLNSHGYDIVKRDESEPAPPVKVFENPPEDLFEGFEYTGPPDGYERIIVQVTKHDMEDGVLKVPMLRKDGWGIDKVFLDGQIVRMKMPAEKLAAIRGERDRVYRGWLGKRKFGAPGDVVDPKTGRALGTAIEAQVVPNGEEYTTEQILEMSRTGIVPPAMDD